MDLKFVIATVAVSMHICDDCRETYLGQLASFFTGAGTRARS